MGGIDLKIALDLDYFALPVRVILALILKRRTHVSWFMLISMFVLMLIHFVPMYSMLFLSFHGELRAP